MSKKVYYIIVDPLESLAEVYHLQNGRYIKLIDAANELVEFILDECEKNIEFDFSKIW